MRLKTLLITLVAVFMAVAACATVSTNAGRNEYTAGAAQTIFNYTFKIYADTDLDVYVTPVGQTPDDAVDITTAYTVAGAGDDAGGSITLNSGTTSGDLVTIVSAIPTNRTIDYQFNGDFRPNVVNNDFDRAVSLVKQLENDSINTLKYQNSFQGGAGTLPDPVASNVIGYDGLAQLTNLVLGVDGNSWDGLADLGDNAIGKGSDLVAHTGTADNVTEALAKKLPLAGGTMTGSTVNNNGSASTPFTSYVDSTGGAGNETTATTGVVSEDYYISINYQGGGQTFPVVLDGATGELLNLNNRVLTTADGVVNAIIGDSTPGRVTRNATIVLGDGATATRIDATFGAVWNGGTNTVEVDIAKGTTDGKFTFAADGTTLTTDTDNTSIAVLSSVVEVNETSTVYHPKFVITGGDIVISLYALGSTTPVDISTLVDAGDARINLTYLTAE